MSDAHADVIIAALFQVSSLLVRPHLIFLTGSTIRLRLWLSVTLIYVAMFVYVKH